MWLISSSVWKLLLTCVIIFFSIAGMFYTHKISLECVVYNVIWCNPGDVIFCRNIWYFNVIVIVIIMFRTELTTIFRKSPGIAYTGIEAAIGKLRSFIWSQNLRIDGKINIVVMRIDIWVNEFLWLLLILLHN